MANVVITGGSGFLATEFLKKIKKKKCLFNFKEKIEKKCKIQNNIL